MKNVISNEQNQLMAIQKIEKQIFFGKKGPWTKYFKALLFFGIDVESLVIENAKLKAEKNKLMDRISSLQDKTINQLRRERGLAPLGDPNISERYLSVSTSEE